jgi:oligopeptidase B
MQKETGMSTPPIAEARPRVVVSPNGSRTDDYFWLRDDTRRNPEVLAYLEAENAYSSAMLAHVKPLEDTIYGEIVGRIKQDDSSVPYRKRGFWWMQSSRSCWMAIRWRPAQISSR